MQNAMKFNYAIIHVGNTRIEGWVDDWEILNTSNTTINLRVDGTWYKTACSNVLLMHKDKDE